MSPACHIMAPSRNNQEPGHDAAPSIPLQPPRRHRHLRSRSAGPGSRDLRRCGPPLRRTRQSCISAAQSEGKRTPLMLSPAGDFRRPLGSTELVKRRKFFSPCRKKGSAIARPRGYGRIISRIIKDQIGNLTVSVVRLRAFFGFVKATWTESADWTETVRQKTRPADSFSQS